MRRNHLLSLSAYERCFVGRMGCVACQRLGDSMKGRTGITLAFACFATISTPVFAAKLPAIKVAENNVVPQCATPGRLVAFLKTRNAKLNPRYEGIGTEYMRYGEELGVRWDIAFFQMMLETGNLTYTGDVK